MTFCHSAPTLVYRFRRVDRGVGKGHVPHFVHRVLFRPIFRRRGPVKVVFSIPTRVYGRHAFLINLLLRLYGAVLYFVDHATSDVQRFNHYLLPRFGRLREPNGRSLLIADGCDVYFLHDIHHFLRQCRGFFQFRFLCLPARSLRAPYFPLGLRFGVLRALFRLFLLVSRDLFRIRRALFLLRGITLPTNRLRLATTHFFLFSLPLGLLPLLVRVYGILLTFDSFRFPLISLYLHDFFFNPPCRGLLSLTTICNLIRLLVRPTSLLRHVRLFLLALHRRFIPFVVPSILLRRLGVKLVQGVTSILHGGFLSVRG